MPPAAIPDALEKQKIQLAKADEFESAQPLVSYLCRFYVVRKAMSLDTNDPVIKAFLNDQFVRLEQLKQTIGQKPSDSESSLKVMEVALKIFNTGDKQDRSKQYREALRAYRTSLALLEVAEDFADGKRLPQQVASTRKYAKHRVAVIGRGLQANAPDQIEPPQIVDDDENDAKLLAELEADNGLNGGTNPTPRGSATTPSPYGGSPSGTQGGPFAGQPPATHGHPGYGQQPPQGYGQPQQAYGQPQYQQQQPQHQQPPPQQGHQPMYTDMVPQSSRPTSVFHLPNGAQPNEHASQQEIEEAAKYCKYVVSALAFQDVSAAVENLTLALNKLTRPGQ